MQQRFYPSETFALQVHHT